MYPPATETKPQVVVTSSEFTFPRPKGYDQMSFFIEANGGTAADSLRSYCSSINCSIPLVFGGEQTISILEKDKTVIAKYEITSGENRFYCINGGWERRICRFRDICFDNNNLTFISPYPINSTVPFIVLGGRSPPYDKKRDRIYHLKVNVSNEYTIPEGRKVHKRTTFYAGPYYNVHMMWHLFFDFALPLFHTTTLFDTNDGKLPDVIIPKSADYPKTEVIKAFTSSFGRMKDTECYKDLVVGISKVKDAETGKLYDFPKNFTHKLMPLVLKHLKLSDKVPKKPMILLVGRRTKVRSLVNFQETLDMLKETFSSHEVKPIYFEEHDMKDQIKEAYQSTILIGVHGSGLAHLAWMRPGTTVVEIFPYKFECRDWYERATAVSGVRYVKYVPASGNETDNPSKKAVRCWETQNGCDGSCVDTLRDQNIRIDITAFKKLMMNVVNQ